jgi:hypothetical protein
MHGEEKNFCAGIILKDLQGGFDAAHSGHAHVQNQEVGTQFPGLGDGFISLNGFAANRPFLLTFHQAPDTATHDFVVVSDENAFANIGTLARIRLKIFLIAKKFV